MRCRRMTTLIMGSSGAVGADAGGSGGSSDAGGSGGSSSNAGGTGGTSSDAGGSGSGDYDTNGGSSGGSRSGDGGTTGGSTDPKPRGADHPPKLGAQIDRMGRAAIATAGGFAEFADRGRVNVYRRVGKAMTKQTIGLDQPIMPGDTVVVLERWL